MSKLGVHTTHDAHGDFRPRKRLSQNPVRRLAAAVAALALGAGLALVGVAAPASAHHNTITPSVVCDTDGTPSITWTVSNSEKDKDETITASSNPGVVPVGSAIKKGKSESFVQADVEPGTYSLQLKALWSSSGATSTDSGSITITDEQCDSVPTVKKITFCHATHSETNPFVKITTSVNAFFRSGHDKHQDLEDIYPTFSYEKHGKTYTVEGRGDQSLLEYEDCIKPAPEEIEVEGVPSLFDVCGPANERLTLPEDTKFIDWSSTRDGNVITVTATAKAGYVFKPGSTFSWTFTVNDDACPPVVVPVGGEPTFADTCGVDNEELSVPSDTDFVDWNDSRAGDVITVTATAKDGYAFEPGAKTVWTFTVNDGDCIIDVVGVPSFQDTCGPENEQLTVPEDTDFIDWNDSRTGDVITVTATAKDGYAFAEGATTEWKFDVDDEDCLIEVVGAPTFEDVCGPDNERLTVPADTDTIDWNSTEENGVITVTATAKAGSKFPEGATVTWTYTVDDSDCVVELEGAPTFSDVCGPDNEQLTVPADTDTIDWAQAEQAGVITVTATAKPGYTFEQGDVVTWTYTLDDEACAEPSLDGSVATGTCIADAPWIFYDITLTDPDQQATSHDASLVLSDGTNTETIALGAIDDSGKLQGKVLWPGASVDDEGNANGWPGWKQLDDGTWVETDGNFAWTRALTSAELIVNPELKVALAYPPATPDCIAAPPVDPENPTEPTDPATPAASGSQDLAETGFAGTSIAIAAGVIVLAGIAFVVVARLRRKKA